MCLQILSTTMVQICSIWCIYKGSRSPRHILSSSGLFLHNPDIFRIIQKLSRLSRYIFRSSRLFLEYPDTFFRLSGHFLHHLETFLFIPTLFLIIRKLSTSSGHFVCYLDILCSIWTFSKIFGNSSANNDLVSKAFRSALLRR